MPAGLIDWLRQSVGYVWQEVVLEISLGTFSICFAKLSNFKSSVTTRVCFFMCPKCFCQQVWVRSRCQKILVQSNHRHQWQRCLFFGRIAVQKCLKMTPRSSKETHYNLLALNQQLTLLKRVASAIVTLPTPNFWWKFFRGIPIPCEIIFKSNWGEQNLERWQWWWFFSVFHNAWSSSSRGWKIHCVT